MELYEIYGNGYEPSLFIIAGWFSSPEVYSFNRVLGWSKREDMTIDKFKKHCAKMKQEGFKVHKITNSILSGIFSN